VGSGTGPGAGVVISSPEPAQGEVAQGFWELERVGPDRVLPRETLEYGE